MQINWEEQVGSETDPTTQGSSAGEKSLKISDWKHLWGLRQQQEKLPASQEFVGETHRVLEHTQTHPHGNQYQKGPIWLWVAGEVTENWQRADQVELSLSDPCPTYSVTKQPHGLPHPGEHLRLCPLLCNSQAETKNKKQGPKKNSSKLQKKYTKQQRDSQPIRCRVQNTGYQDAPGNHWFTSTA